MTKVCSKCHATKALSDFFAAKRRKDGCQPYCKVCHQSYKKTDRARNYDRIRATAKRSQAKLAADPETIERVRARGRRYYHAHKELMKMRAIQYKKDKPRQAVGYGMRRRYGVGLEKYDNLLHTQSGRCAICNDTMSDPHVDHCHTIGRIRGLLCGNCNRMLGCARDSRLNLLAGVAYLDAFRGTLTLEAPP
jgi:hypothetical protein